MDFFCIFVVKITLKIEKKMTNNIIQLFKKHFNKVEDVSYSNDDSDSILVDDFLKVFMPTNDDKEYQLIHEVGDENSNFYQYDILNTSKDINEIITNIKGYKKEFNK